MNTGFISWGRDMVSVVCHCSLVPEYPHFSDFVDMDAFCKDINIVLATIATVSWEDYTLNIQYPRVEDWNKIKEEIDRVEKMYVTAIETARMLKKVRV